MTNTAFGEAYRTGFERTVRFLTSRGAPQDGALEAAQAAWVRGWERLNQLRNEEMVLTWVNSIALNVYRGVVRRQALTQPLPELHSKFKIDLCAIDLDRVLKFCRPWLERQPAFESRARVATFNLRRAAGWRTVWFGSFKPHPDAGQIRLAIGCSRRRPVQIRLAVRPFRDSWLRMQGPLCREERRQGSNAH